MSQEPRLFVAVPLDEAAVSALAGVVEGVRTGLEDGRGIRWVRLDGLHLTLRFLGPTSPDRLEAVSDAVREAADGQVATRLVLSGAGAFPPRGRPRTLWFGITEGVAELAALAVRIDDALARGGWEQERRPFRAHVTIARTDGARAGAAAAASLRAAAADLVVAATVDRIVLFESVTGGGPARYVALAEASLSRPAPGGTPDPGPPEGASTATSD